MATLVLSQVGSAIGGPLGALGGSLAGSAIDQAIFAPPNLADLTRQGADYGAAIPRVYGTIRVAGNVLWSSGLQSSGFGGKLVGGGTSYSTSIAIGVSARPVLSFGRIWADGKLMRDGGQLAIAGQVRFYLGTEDQVADAAIVANVGAAAAPAFRGIAYVVFDTISLTAFADRVPTFSFEVTADAASVPVGAIAADLFAASGCAVPDGSALVQALDGYGLGRSATNATALEQLATIAPHDPVGGGAALRLVPPVGGAPTALADIEIGAYVGGKPGLVRNWRRASMLRPPRTVTIGYMDATRQYQSGLQTANGDGASHVAIEQDLPAVLSAPAARGIAERALRDAETARATRTITLPYSRAPIEVGDAITVAGDATLWRVRRQALEGMVVALDLEATPTWLAAPLAADAGQGPANALAVQGPSVLQILDLPDFAGNAGAGPRLWLAVSGMNPNWRAANLLVSYDGGASYASLGTVRTPDTIGTTTSVLASGTTTGWDMTNSVEIALANQSDGLQSSAAASVLAGANLVAIGQELIGFQTATPTAPGRYVLSGLLRGQFGTEFAASGHAIGEPFALLDQARIRSLDLPVGKLGTIGLFKAVGPLDAPSAIAAQSVVIRGNNLRPISPTNLQLTIAGDGTLNISWTRRSRLGFGWPAGTPPPLGELSENYQIVLTPMAGSSAMFSANTSSVAITPAQQTAKFGATITHGMVAVAQLSALVGASPAASLTF